MSETQAKRLNRRLIELGLVTMKDSPNGKRYGRARRRGRIVEAYGFDLSPLAARHAGVRAAGGGGEGGARGDGASAPAGDDRAQGHRPDPRDRARLCFSRAKNGRR